MAAVDDFSERISQVMSDPAQMAQIMEMANRLGGQPPQEPPSAAPCPEQVQRILSLFGSCGGKEEALIDALCPFLPPEKANKLRRAVRAARLSETVSKVLQEQTGGGTNV